MSEYADRNFYHKTYPKSIQRPCYLNITRAAKILNAMDCLVKCIFDGQYAMTFKESFCPTDCKKK